jgi:hypothetical protein
MNRACRIGYIGCILLIFGFFVGCSDDDTTTVPTTPQQPPLAGSMGVYADAAGTNSNVTDTGGTVTLYVVHKVTEGATACAFRIEAPDGWTLVSTDSPFELTIGEIVGGISIAYGRCLTGTIHVLTLMYQSPGNSTTGSTFKVLPHPEWPEGVVCVSCDSYIRKDGIGLESPVIVP